MQLRARHPDSWELFLTAMKQYAAQITTQMVSCPPELLPRAQGMALQANEIAAVLQNAPKTYEALLAAADKQRKV